MLGAKRVLKFRLGEDLRRRTVTIPLPFKKLTGVLEASFPELESQQYATRYTDEDGDKITVINDEDLVEFFDVFEALNKNALIDVVTVDGEKVSEKEKAIHYGVMCDITKQIPIVGPRYHLRGKNYDLCEAAFHKLPADEKKAFVKIDQPEDIRRYRPSSRSTNRRFIKGWCRRMRSHQNRNRAKFLSDESFPDASVIEVGTAFKKSWKFVGKWGDGCVLEFVGGNDLGAIPRVALGRNDGGEHIISLDFKAPAVEGRYKSFWRLCDSSGKRFGQRVWADIVCVAKKNPQDVANVSCEGKLEKDIPKATSIKDVTSEGKSEKDDIPKDTSSIEDVPSKDKEDLPKATSSIEDVPSDDKEDTSKATFIEDVTCQDKSVFNLHSTFTKTWKVSGKWGKGCYLLFVDGENMTSLASNKIPIESNETSETLVSVDLTAPAVEGVFKCVFRLHDAHMKPFGDYLWAEIVASKNAEGLKTLSSMGFKDSAKCMEALAETNGSVQDAILRILG